MNSKEMQQDDELGMELTIFMPILLRNRTDG